MTVLKHILYILVISMVPVIELRGAIPVGLGLGLSFPVTFVTAYIGNLLPVPFLILFTRRVFAWLRKKSQLLGRFVTKMEQKAASREALLKKYELLGLCILVAIPLPGTGAWTGALVAAMFNIRLKSAMPVIALGVAIAGIIVSMVSLGISLMCR